MGSSSEHRVCGACSPTPNGGPEVLGPSALSMALLGPSGSRQNKECVQLGPKGLTREKGLTGLGKQNLVPLSETDFS